MLRPLIGLLMGLLVAMLASSIVSTSLPRIVSDLSGSQSTLTWIVTATLLAITVSTPIWGKLSDLLSRRALVVAALGCFVAGSTVAGFAPEPITLIAGRAVQGVGAGGLMTLVQIVMADLISPRDRGKYMGLFGAVLALGTIGGPLVGGVVTDVAGWRWNFFGSIPIAIASLIIVLVTLRPTPRQGRARIDYAGAVLITAGVSSLLIWVTLAGVEFDWVSLPSGLILGGALVILVSAVLVEAKVREPIIPLSLFRNRAFVLTVIASVSVGVATYGAAVFMSQYLQISREASPTESGIVALPQVICVTVASTVVGALISRTGRWKLWMAIGAGAQALGLILLGTIDTATPPPLLWAYLVLVGFGIGSVMQNLVLVAENNIDARQLGVASAGIVFFRTMGGTIGVAALGAFITARAQSALLAAAVGPNVAAVDIDQITETTSLAEPLKGAVQDAYARGVGDAYLLASVLALVTFIAILLLPAKPLSTMTRKERLAELELDTAVALGGGDHEIGEDQLRSS